MALLMRGLTWPRTFSELHAAAPARFDAKVIPGKSCSCRNCIVRQCGVIAVWCRDCSNMCGGWRETIRGAVFFFFSLWRRSWMRGVWEDERVCRRRVFIIREGVWGFSYGPICCFSFWICEYGRMFVMWKYAKAISLARTIGAHFYDRMLESSLRSINVQNWLFWISGLNFRYIIEGRVKFVFYL